MDYLRPPSRLGRGRYWVGLLALAVSGAAFPLRSAQSPTPAEQRILAAERATRATPTSADAFNDLALALARRARETSDVQYYARAEQAIETSLKLVPDNFEALKMRAWVLLGTHEFAAALELARSLNKRAPDDLLVYGFLTDANVELGNYKEAEEACQWMLDLRPGNIPAFTRAAYLREMFGDIEGAIELMTKAHDRTPPYETEDRAWLLTQIAHLLHLSGKATEAEQMVNEALTLFPNYHYALGQLAKIRDSQKRFAEAAALQQRRYDMAPHPENLYELARALDRAKRSTEARRAYQTFEKQARAESDRWDNANRELIFYYTDVARQPAEALRIAKLEYARRQDVYTLDAYAWALYANKQMPAAKTIIGRALAVGVADPNVLAHAAVIGR
jgi:tetratricopeptide (TPR) repeat protein